MPSSSGARSMQCKPKIGLSSGRTVSPAQIRRRGLKPLRAEHGRLVSPESYFLRTGKIPKGIRKRRTKKLAERFLSKSWYEGLKGKKRRVLPLPSFEERLKGKKLSEKGIAEVKRQTAFVLDKFARHLSDAERIAAGKKLGKLLTKRTISASAWLRQEGRDIDLGCLRDDVKRFYVQHRQVHKQYYGFVSSNDGVFLARGFADYAHSVTTPVHE